MTRISLRAATAEALPFLTDCFLRSMRDSIEASRGQWDEVRERAQFAQQLDLELTRIVSSNGVDVGFVMVVSWSRYLHVHTLCIAPEHQSLGHGSEVVRRVIAEAGRTGRSVGLSVLKTNPRAQALYERLGFSTVEESATHRHLKHQPAPDRDAASRRPV